MWLLITTILMLTNVIFVCTSLYYRDKCKSDPVCDDKSPAQFYDDGRHHGKHHGTFAYGRQVA